MIEPKIFKTVDRGRLAVIYQFYWYGVLYQFETLGEAKVARDRILKSQEPNRLQEARE